MIRRLFTVASAMSLLLCVAAFSTWATFNERVVFLRRDGGLYRFLHALGSLVSLHPLHAPNTRRLPEICFFSFQGRIGFGWAWSDVLFDRELSAPFGLIMVLTACMLLIWLASRRPSTKSGVCRSCGYDLRASNGRCPECGTPIPSHADRALNSVLAVPFAADFSVES